MNNDPIDTPVADKSSIRVVEIDLAMQNNDQEFKINTAAAHNYDPKDPWYKIFAEGTVAEDSLNYAHSVIETSDGGYIIASANRLVTDSYSQILLIKVNSGGVVEWANNYGTAVGQEGFAKTTIKEVPSGGYIIGTESTSFRGYTDKEIILIKIDEDGNLGSRVQAFPELGRGFMEVMIMKVWVA